MDTLRDPRAGAWIEPRTVTGEVAAQALGVSRATAWKLLTSGELRSIKVGRRRLVPVDAIDQFIARRLAETDGAA